MVDFTRNFLVQATGITLALPQGSPSAGSTFVITGEMTGFATTPDLVYRDDGGSEFSVNSIGFVTPITLSFTHPGMQAGTHTVEVYPAGGGISGSITFSVLPSFVPGPVHSIAVLATTANSLRLTWAEPDTQQVYGYNLDVSSTGASGPFQLNFSGISLTGTPPSYLLTGLTRDTDYWVKIAAVANQTSVGPPTTAGPFRTSQQTLITLAPVTAFTGSPFEMSGTIS
jgi:hypothetical protein